MNRPLKIFYLVGHSNPKSGFHMERIEYKLIAKIAREKRWIIDVVVKPSPGLEDFVHHNYNFRKQDLRKPRDWEDNLVMYKKVEEQLGSVERALGTSFSRCYYAERRINRTLTQKNFDAVPSPLYRYCMHAKDNERKIIMRLFVMLRDALTDSKPDAAIIHNYCGAVNFMCGLLCRYYGIPFFNPQDVSIFVEKMRFNSHYFFHENEDFERQYNNKLQSGIEPSAKAKEYVKQNKTTSRHFNEWQRTRDTKRIAAMRPKRIVKQTYFEMRSFAGRLVKRIAGQELPNFYNAFFLHKTWFWIKANFRHKKRIRIFSDFTEQQLINAKYIYLPLHQDPEQQLTTEAPIWGDVIPLIEMLVKMIPFGYQLYVRDHIDNVGIRPKGFYEHLSRLPGVVLVEPRCPSAKFIKHSGLIITLNGTTGWEGLLMKKPVITLAKAFYDLTGLTYKVDDINKLDKIILNAIYGHGIQDEGDYYKKLALMVDVADEIGFSDDDEAVNDCITRIEAAVVVKTASAIIG